MQTGSVSKFAVGHNGGDVTGSSMADVSADVALQASGILNDGGKKMSRYPVVALANLPGGGVKKGPCSPGWWVEGGRMGVEPMVRSDVRTNAGGREEESREVRLSNDVRPGGADEGADVAPLPKVREEGLSVTQFRHDKGREEVGMTVTPRCDNVAPLLNGGGEGLTVTQSRQVEGREEVGMTATCGCDNVALSGGERG